MSLLSPTRHPASLGRGDGPTLLVASTGGHLEQLIRLRERLGEDMGPFEWATFDGNQSRALLAGETVHYVGYIKPRDFGAVARDLPDAIRLIREGHYRAVVSTGSGIALPFFVAARLHGVPCHYIESAARSDGPSLTGRLLGALPGTRRYTQYEALATRRWAYCGSLFDGFAADAAPAVSTEPQRPLSRVVVTLGTMPGYGFRSAVEQLTRLLPEVCAPDVEILWQTGATDLSGLGVDGHDQIPATVLRDAMREADLVVAHGGIGSALNTLDSGRAPVLLPRRVSRGEHVDDHQVLICEQLDSRGIAVGREVEDLTVEDLWRAARTTVHSTTDVVPLELVGTSH